MWIGPSTGGDWFNGANWSSGVPTSGTDAIIPSTLGGTITASLAAECAGLSLGSGWTLSLTAYLDV
jgi:hypothetical protein